MTQTHTPGPWRVFDALHASIRSEPRNAWRVESKTWVTKSKFAKQLNRVSFLIGNQKGEERKTGLHAYTSREPKALGRSRTQISHPAAVIDES